TADHPGLPYVRAVGITDRTAGVVDSPPVRTPLPDVARDVVQPEAVGREGVDRASAEVTVVAGVLRGERPLPDVAAVVPSPRELVSPGNPRLLEPTARGVLPLGFGREPHSAPAAVGRGIAP